MASNEDRLRRRRELKDRLRRQTETAREREARSAILPSVQVPSGSSTRFNHVEIQVVICLRLMTCQCVHLLRLAPRCY